MFGGWRWFGSYSFFKAFHRVRSLKKLYDPSHRFKIIKNVQAIAKYWFIGYEWLVALTLSVLLQRTKTETLSTFDVIDSYLKCACNGSMWRYFSNKSRFLSHSWQVVHASMQVAVFVVDLEWSSDWILVVALNSRGTFLFWLRGKRLTKPYVQVFR